MNDALFKIGHFKNLHYKPGRENRHKSQIHLLLPITQQILTDRKPIALNQELTRVCVFR